MPESIDDFIDLRRWLYSNMQCCAVCWRPARGFGWFDMMASGNRFRPPRKFCSIACQNFWCRLVKENLSMIDLSEQEQAAIRAAIKPAAEIMEEIGWQTRLIDLTEAQVLALIKGAVGGFQDAMHTNCVAIAKATGTAP